MAKAPDLWETIVGTLDPDSNLQTPFRLTTIQSVTPRLWLPQAETWYGKLYTDVASHPFTPGQEVTESWWSVFIERPGDLGPPTEVLIRATLSLRQKVQRYRGAFSIGQQEGRDRDLEQETAEAIFMWCERHRQTWTMGQARAHLQAGVGGFPQWIRNVLEDRLRSLRGPERWPHDADGKPVPFKSFQEPLRSTTGDAEWTLEDEKIPRKPSGGIEVYRTELTVDTRLLIERRATLDPVTRQIVDLELAGRTRREIAKDVGLSEVTVHTRLKRLKKRS